MFRAKIKDWYEIHNGFTLTLEPGFTALVGPNGAGKTTLLRQLADIARERKYRAFRYDNLHDGGGTATQSYMLAGDVTMFATSVTASEGEALALNFGNVVGKIGREIRKTADDDVPLFILLDGLDSGASIDRCQELIGLFDMIERDIRRNPEHIAPVYLVAAVNSYELAKGRCVDVRTGKKKKFSSYDQYADYIMEQSKKNRGGE